MNSKWVIDLNIKCKAIKLSEENERENLRELKLGSVLRKAKCYSLKEKKIDKWDLIKIKNFVLHRHCEENKR